MPELIFNESPEIVQLIDIKRIQMPMVLITPPVTLPNELIFLNAMLNSPGLPRVHLRKPWLSLEEHRDYIQRINPDYRTRITLHDFHELSHEFSLGGVHHRSHQLEGLITAPSPTQIASIGYHNPEDLLLDRGDVGYCFLSPIYNSISKKGYGPTHAALADRKKLAEEFVRVSKHPVVALGGVTATPSVLSELAELGFAGAALLGSIWYAENPLTAMEQALEADSKIVWKRKLNFPV